MNNDEDNEVGEQPIDTTPPDNVSSDKASVPEDNPKPHPLHPHPTPDDMEEALVWLEQLAAKQGVSVEELTSRYPDALELSFPELSPAQSDELPEWLKEVPPERRLREFPSSAGETAAMDDIPDWLLLEPPAVTQDQELETGEFASELDSRLDWLAEMGKKDELAEMPTVRWRPDDSGLPGLGLPDSAEWNELEFAEGTGSAESFAEMGWDAPEDLDQAMAWLEELATSQDTPLEELPSVADHILASRIMAESGIEPEEDPHIASMFTPTVSAEGYSGEDDVQPLDVELNADPAEQTDFPDDLNEAMDYLDTLALARQRTETPVAPEAPMPDEIVLAADEIITADLIIETEAGDAAEEMTPNDFGSESEIPPTAEDIMFEDVQLVAGSANEETADGLDELALEADELVTDESEAFGEEREVEAVVLADGDDFEPEPEADAAGMLAPLILEAKTSSTSAEDPLELALIRLDRQSLPPHVTLESLGEVLLHNTPAPGLNGQSDYDDGHGTRNGYDAHDLDDTLLWVEQQLDAPPDAPIPPAPISEAADFVPDVEERPNELMLELAALDDEVVAELTADMPDDPDEALTWLMGLADEAEQPLTPSEIQDFSGQPEIEGFDELISQGGARVYDVVEHPAVEQPVVEASVPAQSEPMSLAADELPEMPDDPDEAIAWIERLSAMEGEGSDGEYGGDEYLVDEYISKKYLAAEYLAGAEAIESVEPGEWDIEDVPEEVTLIVESGVEPEAGEDDEGQNPPEPAEETKPETKPATRQPHERWLDMLQPPSWTKKR
jgi:hypothetical protein